MDNITVVRKGDHLVVGHRISKSEQVNAVEREIIDRGEIPALLPVQLHKRLGGMELRFQIRGLEDLRTFLGSDPRFDQFVSVVMQILDTMAVCGSYGISRKGLEMDCDLIYYDRMRQQVKMLCWPVITLAPEEDLSSGFRELGTAYISRGQDGRYRQMYLELFNSRAKFQLSRFSQELQQILEQWRQERQSGGTVSGVEPVKIHPGAMARTGQPVVLLLGMDGKPRVRIDRFPFRIGRVAKYCDHAIEGDSSISRQHLTISFRDGRFLVRDEDSANGTFLDGARLPAGVDVALRDGGQLRVGNQILTVRLLGPS